MNNSDSCDALAELLTLTLTVNDEGTHIYRNTVGQWHRVHGPAVQLASGDRFWYQHGELHSTSGPAMEYFNGDRSWYIQGHRLTEQEFHDQLETMSVESQCNNVNPTEFHEQVLSRQISCTNPAAAYGA